MGGITGDETRFRQPRRPSGVFDIVSQGKTSGVPLGAFGGRMQQQ